MTNSILSSERAKAIVDAWRDGDPIDQMRRRQRQANFAKPVGPAYTHQLAVEVERLATRRLESLGHLVEPTSHKAAFDLLVDHALKIELKAGNWTRGRFMANIKPRQRRAADLVLFACRAGAWRWFVIPARAIDTRTIEITSFDVDAYTGRWAIYLGQWSIVESMLPTARARTRQLSLAEVL